MKELEELISEYFQKKNRAIEMILVETIERHIGRVPSNKEVSDRGHHKVFPHSGEEKWFWGDTLLFVTRPIKDKIGIEIQKHV